MKRALLGVFTATLAALVLQGCGGPKPIDVSQMPDDRTMDRNPPRRGEPGYRERITDAPTPGDATEAAPARGNDTSTD